MYKVKKVSKLDISSLNTVARILYACGKDMAQEYNFHHWDNPYIKTIAIVGVCGIKSEIYLLYDDNKPVATFMIQRDEDEFRFEKLGTFPSESGKGIGSYCMRKIEEMAKEAGCKRIVMAVYEPNKHAISFYKHKGYTVVGTTKTMKYREVKMEKSI